MSVYAAFQRLLPYFTPHAPHTPANTFTFGIVASGQPPFSVTVSRQEAYLTENIKQAEYIIYGDSHIFEQVLDPAIAQRRELVEQLELRPNYPYNNYLISILLKAFGLDVTDLDYEPKNYDGPFPFLPRYPVAENAFRQRAYEPAPLPKYQADSLPELIADEHPHWVAMYEKAWQIAFKNLRQPAVNSGFIASFIDPAFNPNTFLWDTCFMTMFGRYARHNFNFMGSLDNFYAKQHDDGFICREINTYSGQDLFQSLDPRSTGPNILAWTEWQHYQHSQDRQRLRDVFPVLIGYHRWWQEWRTHPDGSYWTSGWGSGMDNQTRVPDSEYHHRHYTWVDAMMQQALSCQILLKIAQVIGRDEFDAELTCEFDEIRAYLNTQMWDEPTGFYYDRAPDGTLSATKSIGAFWGLLSDVIPSERADQMIAHLENEQSFNRPHPIPTQAYDSADYNPYGGYWLGGVWSPTNYMVLCGLTQRGYHALAHQIAMRHVEQITAVYAQTGTVYENYSPEYTQPGKPARPDFVGWTGLSAITIPIEYLLGIHKPDSSHTLVWHLHLTERHGIKGYPLGHSNHVDLICAARQSSDENPVLTLKTQKPIMIHFVRGHDQQTVSFEAGQHVVTLFN